MVPSCSALNVLAGRRRIGEMPQADGLFQRLAFTHHLIVEDIPRRAPPHPRMVGILDDGTRQPLVLLLTIVLGQVVLEGLHG